MIDGFANGRNGASDATAFGQREIAGRRIACRTWWTKTGL
jgi:hypothetical protein